MNYSFKKRLKTTVVVAFVLSFLAPEVMTSVSAQKVVAAANSVTTTVTRNSKVSKTEIVETSIQKVVTIAVKQEKNAKNSVSTVNLGSSTLKNQPTLKISVVKTEVTKKTASQTTVETTVTTTKKETFKKAAKNKLKFTFAMGSPGMSGTLIREAIERINFKYGYTGTFQEIASSDLVVAGGAAGQFEMGSSTTSAVMKVIQDGAPLTFIGETQRNQWTLVAKTNIGKCEDITGKRLGLHSPGGVSTALYRAWYKRNCAATVKPQELFIAGSPNRLQALISDRLDVTMMEVEDTLSLPATGFKILSNFSKDLPNIKTGLVWVNESFLAKHPDVAADFVYEFSRLSQEFNVNLKAFKANALKWQPSYVNIDAIVAAYSAARLFPDEPGAFFKDLNETAAFYAATGAMKPGLVAKDMAVLGPINSAVERLGF